MHILSQPCFANSLSFALRIKSASGHRPFATPRATLESSFKGASNEGEKVLNIGVMMRSKMLNGVLRWLAQSLGYSLDGRKYPGPTMWTFMPVVEEHRVARSFSVRPCDIGDVVFSFAKATRGDTEP